MTKKFYNKHGLLAIHGDMREVLRQFPNDHFHACVTDPPYELSFMGRGWDKSGVAFRPDTWSEVLRVLRPGAHLLAFGGSRTFHRLACAVEDAGFEIRDTICWHYGCLSDDTELLVDGQWQQYSKARHGRSTLCYDYSNDSYSWQPIDDIYVYDYDDTAFRIHSDHTDQIVSRNHRCLVERGGRIAFQLAETLELQASVPFLESVPVLRDGIPLFESNTSDKEQILWSGMRGESYVEKIVWNDMPIQKKRRISYLRDMRQSISEVGISDTASECELLLSKMQWKGTRQAFTKIRQAWACWLDREKPEFISGKDDWREQSGLERRGNVFSKTRKLQADQVYSMPRGFHGNGEEGRLCHGASLNCCAINWAMSFEDGSSASRRSRSDEQHNPQSVFVQKQQGSQDVRVARHTRTTLARIEPFHYVGKVWCVKVPTGAFVARRNGKIFVTGNSGFPKSLDVSKAIDKAAGSEREVISKKRTNVGIQGGNFTNGSKSVYIDVTIPSTDAAKQWDGFGTALKPATEFICLASKPLEKGLNIAQNVLKWGCGALNIDVCRISANGDNLNGGRVSTKTDGWDRPWKHDADAIAACHERGKEAVAKAERLGRYPANLALSHSPDCKCDGNKNIEDWQCVEDCPVRIMNKQSGVLTSGTGAVKRTDEAVLQRSRSAFGSESRPIGTPNIEYGDSGGAARFFYTSKASGDERPVYTKECGTAIRHPTVKPIDLMEWLCKLVVPPAGICLDPFLGSGTTLEACYKLNFKGVGIELEDDHLPLILDRFARMTKSIALPGFE